MLGDPRAGQRWDGAQSPLDMLELRRKLSAEYRTLDCLDFYSLLDWQPVALHSLIRSFRALVLFIVVAFAQFKLT